MGSTLFAFQQLSGINAVFYFSSTVFKSFGVSSDLANTSIGISNLLGTDLHLFCASLNIYVSIYMHVFKFSLCTASGSIIAMTLMDKLGRKVLLLGSFSGMVGFERKWRQPSEWRIILHALFFSLTCLFLGSLVRSSSNRSKLFRNKFWRIVPFCWWNASVSGEYIALQ